MSELTVCVDGESVEFKPEFEAAILTMLRAAWLISASRLIDAGAQLLGALTRRLQRRSSK